MGSITEIEQRVTDAELESNIEAAYQAMISARHASDKRRWWREMARLIGMRSGGQVQKMEQEQGCGDR